MPQKKVQVLDMLLHQFPGHLPKLDFLWVFLQLPGFLYQIPKLVLQEQIQRQIKDFPKGGGGMGCHGYGYFITPADKMSVDKMPVKIERGVKMQANFGAKNILY